MGDWLAVFAEPGKVQLNGLPHLGQDCVLGVCQCDTARQIRAPCAVSAVAGSFYHDRVAGHGVLRSSPACLRMLRSVPGGNSAVGLPAIVTRPGLSGCLYCRWLPTVVIRYQPSASISLIISRTFRGTDYSISCCPAVPRRSWGRAACCWHGTGSLRHWNLLSQARPYQALQHRSSYLNDQRSRCARTARGRSTWSLEADPRSGSSL